MSQAHSRGDASLDVQDDLTADERARARTGAPGERDAARRHRATPAPDPLVLRHCRRADRGRLCGDSGVARRGLDPQRGLGHRRDQRVAADAVSERVQRSRRCTRAAASPGPAAARTRSRQIAMNATAKSRNSMLEKTLTIPVSRSATSAAMLAKLISLRAARS